MMQAISGLFDNYDDAHAAMNALEASGVPHSDISIVASNADNRHAAAEANSSDDAGKGALVGTAVGGIGGLLAGLGMLAIPGVGPVVAAGWLVATAVGAGAGAAVGGAAGGLISSLTAAGVPEEHAHIYAEGVRRGGTLVTARVVDDKATAARSILTSHHSVDPVARGGAYRASGWTGFNASADPYTAGQIEDERGRYNRPI